MKKNLFCWFVCLAPLFALEIKVPESASPAILRAAGELQEYIVKMQCADDSACFQLLIDPDLPREGWKISSEPDGVTLSGGSPRGLLYAVYHYLEDVCGVSWWSYYEESVPVLKSLPVDNLDRSGCPAFAIRGIYSLYARDQGRFAARMRINSDGENLERIRPEFGGEKFIGPPDFCHTFAGYIPAERYFDRHPEWFSLYDGQRHRGIGSASDASQLCMSNLALRKEMQKRLRDFIRQGEEEAALATVPKPYIYNISQNDGPRHCQCSECAAACQRYGGQLSGLNLEFVNAIAGDIAAEYPDLLVSTLAYNKTDAPPSNIVAAPNVMVVLCNVKGNAVLPICPTENSSFYHLVKRWSELTEHLYVWEYGINYRDYNELAYPSEYTYAPNRRFYLKHNVNSIFAEFESPMYSDVREYKMYLFMKLLEDPNQDFDTLSRKFTDGYYGVAAGALFREYRLLLWKAVQDKKPFIGFTPTPDSYLHLDLDTIQIANQLFDAGCKLLAEDPVRLKRWRHARISLDRSVLYRAKTLKRQYLLQHGSLDGYPLDLATVADRLRQCWQERLHMRPLSQPEDATLAALEKTIEQYSRSFTAENLLAPDPFRKFSPEKVFDFTMENSSRYRDFAALVDDPEASSGFAARLQLPDAKAGVTLESHRLPLPFGIYSESLRKSIFKGEVTSDMVRKPGYNWYCLGTTRLTADAYLFCYPSWLIQQVVAEAFDSENPDSEFELWVNLKLTGGPFPLGGNEEPALWLDRVVLVKQ